MQTRSPDRPQHGEGQRAAPRCVGGRFTVWLGQEHRQPSARQKGVGAVDQVSGISEWQVRHKFQHVQGHQQDESG